MSAWTFVSTIADGGYYGRTITPSALPAGVVDGDLIVFVAQTSGVESYQDVPVCNTPGWSSADPSGIYLFYKARYYNGLLPPTITLTVGTTNYVWYSAMAAFRPSGQWATGPKSIQFGAPPSTTNVKTTSPDTLLVLLSSTVGESGTGWTVPDDFSQNYFKTSQPMLSIAHKNVPTAGTSLDVGTSLPASYSSRYSLVVAAQNQTTSLFFMD